MNDIIQKCDFSSIFCTMPFSHNYTSKMKSKNATLLCYSDDILFKDFRSPKLFFLSKGSAHSSPHLEMGFAKFIFWNPLAHLKRVIFFCLSMLGRRGSNDDQQKNKVNARCTGALVVVCVPSWIAMDVGIENVKMSRRKL